MSTIPSTQPTQNDLQQTPNTAREGATQATTPEATQPATQWDKVEAMAVGVEIVEPTVDKQHVVWLINPVNKVLEVLTVRGPPIKIETAFQPLISLLSG
ncbi:hypothetical protein MJO29_016453 [Puccinia striiformis f. sp. tritici]|nr:hypothetical protein MJO29_016453 [Puccinia striiformis f. sp. tritici]